MKQWAARRMRKAGWNKSALDDTIRSRIYHACSERGAWWGWGRSAMWLVGRNDSGSAGAPRARDLWYVRLNDLEQFQLPFWADQANKLGFVTTTDYRTVRAHPDIDWKIFDLQDDGHTLVVGYWPTPGGNGRIQPASIQGNEIALFWRWYWITHRLKAQWLGLRPWIYYKALHATVHKKKPFSCQVTPPRGPGGGYSHWHCQLRKRHAGDHRYVNYTWAREGEQVEYAPSGGL
jgi:hypothetical protein